MAASAGAADAGGSDSGSGHRILVVEDERIVAQDLASTLEELGYVVVGMAATGDEAILQARTKAPSLVLMDIRLAGPVDGVEATAAIRSTSDIPVIYLTAHSDDETLRRAKETGPFGYLVKPFKTADLRCAIEIALHKHEIDASLRERERWLRATLRAIGDSAISMDTEGKGRLLSAVVEALRGWTHDEAIGLALREILNLAADGRPPPADRAATEGHRDEDDIRRLNAELEQRVVERTKQLEAANRELEAFSYSVAHDLRAPLRGIDGFSQALLEEHASNLGPEGLAHLRAVRAGTRRMAQLIDDLLRLSQVARSDFREQVTDLSRLARIVIGSLRAADPGRHVEVAIQADVTVKGDERLLRIVLENIMGNAWKFTSKVQNPRIEFGATTKDGTLVCFVRDNGAGFDMEYAHKLFGAFQRLHSSKEFEGTGVGLAIVQRIINRHGGRIWADSAVGQGTTFYLSVAK